MPLAKEEARLTTRRRPQDRELADLRWNSYLTDLCNDEHEPYFPADGTYYSSCGYFRPVDLETIRGYWKNTVSLMRAGKAPSQIGIYIHWPFCVSHCLFCFCSMGVHRGAREMRDYADTIKLEIDALKDIFTGVSFASVYFGGGTPTLSPDGVLDDLLGHIQDSFSLAPDQETYVEASPGTLTAGKMKILMKRGVNRITIGVQSLDAQVLARNNRQGQPKSAVETAINRIVKAKGVYSGVELMFGMAGQTLRSFLRDLDYVMKKDLDAVYVFGFDPRPQTPFSQAGKVLSKRIREGKVNMMPTLKRLAATYGFTPPTVRPESSEYLHTISAQCRVARRFGSSILGLGASALAHAFGSAWYRHLPIEETDRKWQGIQPFFSMLSGAEEEMRGYVVRHMYAGGVISRAGFREIFGRDVMTTAGIAATLKEADDAGEVKIDSDAIRFTDPDRSKRLVFSKRLYSPELHRRLKESHQQAFARFNNKFTDEEVRNFVPVRDKRVAAMMTTFERNRT